MENQPFLPRTIELILTRATGEFPAVVLTGPRQSGKTTLLKHLFGRSHRYHSLELPNVRAAAIADPRGFLELNPAPVIFDEIQYAPGLLPYIIKEGIDARRSRRGQFLLTGSQNLLLAGDRQITESLAETLKVYFTDTGTLCALVGLTSPEHAAAGPLGGAIFETAVIMEVFKALVHRGQDPQLYFWRSADGHEVDLVVDVGGQLIPIEVKLTATPHPGMVEGNAALRNALGAKVGPGWLVHPGDTQLPLGAGVRSIPFAELWELQLVCNWQNEKRGVPGLKCC